MIKITIHEETTKNPCELMGRCAGECYGSDVSDKEKNIKRGKECVASGHGRVLEYPQVVMTIDGASARVIREYMRHVGGGLTTMQASTRYIDYANKGFSYITPSSIAKNKDTEDIWIDLMSYINETLSTLENDYNIPKEDVANGLPLGMTTKIVERRNLRNLMDMSRVRMCNRAYWEFRQLFSSITKALSEYSDEWKWIVDNLFHAKCEEYGYCPEGKSCGKYPKKEEDK